MDSKDTPQINKPYFNSKLAQQFDSVIQTPFDPVHQIVLRCQQDKSPLKINLNVGAYRDQNGKPYVFEVVRKAELQIIQNINKQYLSDVYTQYIQAAKIVMFGKNSIYLKDQRIASMQTISGTGALFLGFYFISNFLPKTPKTVYVSDPTWPTHHDVIQTSGLKVDAYPYYDSETNSFNFEKMIQFLRQVQQGSVILLQSSGHNPTGCDPSKNQWKQISKVMKQRNLIPFFDPAYQGFVTGDLDEDAWVIRYFLQQRFFMFIAQSFAKNLGLYGDRIGALHIVTPNKDAAWKAYTKIRGHARKVYLVPPSHGAFIVDKVVNNEENYNKWLTELKEKVIVTVKNGRQLLRDELQRINTPGKWNHITDQTGMFSFTGLTPRQCEIMMAKIFIQLRIVEQLYHQQIHPITNELLNAQNQQFKRL